MPTQREIVLDRIEERKNPTPVAPTESLPPAPAPVPQTPQTIQGVNGENFQVAPVNTDTGLSTPQVSAPTPVVNTPPVAPKAPEPIATTPEAIKPPTVAKTTENTIDYNKSIGRESEIQKNISEITKENQSLLKDRAQYDKAFGYATADEGKKAILDSNWNGGQITEDPNSMFTSLRAGVSIPASESQAYKQAQSRYSAYRKFSTYDTASLSSALSSGDLLMGTQAYNDLVSDPMMAQKIEKARIFGKGEVNFEQITVKSTGYVMNNNPTVANALADGYLSPDEYNQLTSNPDVVAQGKTMEAKKTDYETYKVKYDSVEDDVNKEFEGKETTDSFKAKIVADRRKSMYKDLQIKGIEYQNSLGTYTELKNSATSLLGLNIEQYNKQLSYQQQIETEKRQMDNTLALSQAQYNQKLAQEEEMMKNPTVAISSVMDQFSKLGIIADKSVQWHMDNFSKSGMSIGDYTAQMTKDFKEKPQYKAMRAREMGTGTSYQTIGDSVYRQNPDGSLTRTDINPNKVEQMKYSFSDLGEGRIAIQNPTTGQVSFATAGSISSANASQFGSLLDYISDSEGTHGNYNAMYGNGGQNKIDLTSMTLSQIQDLQKKSVYTDKNGNYVGGAMGKYQIVSGTLNGLIQRMGLNPNTTLFDEETQDKMAMNLLGNAPDDFANGKISEKDLQLAVSKKWAGVPNPLTGNSYYAKDKTNKANPDNGAFAQAVQGMKQTQTGGMNATPTTFKTDAAPQFQSYLSTGKVGASAEDLKQIAKEFGTVENFRQQAELYNNSENGPREAEINKVSNLRDKFSALLSSDNKGALDNSIGASQWTFPLTGTEQEKQSFLGDISSLLDTKTLQTLIDAKADGATFGALSNDELRMLQRAGEPLSALIIRDKEDPTKIVGLSGTKENFRKKVNEAIQKYDDIISKKQKIKNTTYSTTPQPPKTNTGAGQIVPTANDPALLYN